MALASCSITKIKAYKKNTAVIQWTLLPFHPWNEVQIQFHMGYNKTTCSCKSKNHNVKPRTISDVIGVAHIPMIISTRQPGYVHGKRSTVVHQCLHWLSIVGGMDYGFQKWWLPCVSKQSCRISYAKWLQQHTLYICIVKLTKTKINQNNKNLSEIPIN